MEIIILDGNKMTSLEAAHRYIARTMRFHDYFRPNLDALADCLSELSSDVIVVLMNSAVVGRMLGIDGDRLLRVFFDMSSKKNAFTFIIKND